MPQQQNLFDAPHPAPGLSYERDFISPAEETALLEEIRDLPLEQAQYKEWRAKRRIVAYGGRYDFSEGYLKPAGPIPHFLHPLRERLAEWMGTSPEALTHAVVAEYPPGTQLGWHRDVPDFSQIMGVSLAGPARMRFRPYPPGASRRTVFALELEPRSAYAMTGEARWKWQHAISPTRGLRYSITFRTLVSRPR